MGLSSLPNMTYMKQYLSDGDKSTISQKNLYETLLIQDVDDQNHVYRTPWYDFFLKYKNELEDAVQYYTCPQSMFYKPKLLSLELYGTPELWLSFLRLNGLRNISEFHYPIIRIYNPARLMELINIFFKRENIM